MTEQIDDVSRETRTEWTTQELTEDFEVLGFALGFCVVVRRSDGVRGSLAFERRDTGRVYHSWVQDR